MKTNKGFAGLEILVVILVILAIGGGVYYKNKHKTTVAVEQNTEDTASPSMTEGKKGTTVKTKTNDSVSSAENASATANCTPASKPSITITSPNGGEIFTAGREMAVKWKSCNIPASTPVDILLQGNFTAGPWGASPTSNFNLASVLVGGGNLINSGSETFTLPTQVAGGWTGNSTTMTYGNYYKVYISRNLASAVEVSDISDNSFTISGSTFSTKLPTLYVNTMTNNGAGWPPVIKTSTAAYSCTASKATTQKTINGKNYCVTSVEDAAMGSRSGQYTYTTANGTGTKTASFSLVWSSCGGYGAPGDTQYDQCQSTVSGFFSTLDVLIASLI